MVGELTDAASKEYFPIHRIPNTDPRSFEAQDATKQGQPGTKQGQPGTKKGQDKRPKLVLVRSLVISQIPR